LIQDCRRPVPRVSALRRNRAMNHADARHTLIGRCRTLARRPARLSLSRLPRLLSRLRRRTSLRILCGLRCPAFHGSAGMLRRAATLVGGLRKGAD
jgi:hypothetical protein